MDELWNRSEKSQRRTRENFWASCTTDWFIHYVLPLNQSKGSTCRTFQSVFVSSMRCKYVLSSMLQNHCCFARIKASEGWCVIMLSNTREYSSKLLTYGGLIVMFDHVCHWSHLHASIYGSCTCYYALYGMRFQKSKGQIGGKTTGDLWWVCLPSIQESQSRGLLVDHRNSNWKVLLASAISWRNQTLVFLPWHPSDCCFLAGGVYYVDNSWIMIMMSIMMLMLVLIYMHTCIIFIHT